MKPRNKFSAFCTALLMAASARAGVVQVDTSVKCNVTDPNADIRTFNFDLYATGFPMAGVGMYSGMFEADTPGLNCYTMRGSIQSVSASAPKVMEEHATSNCINQMDYVLDVQTDLYRPGVKYPGTLKYRTYEMLAYGGPFGPTDYTTLHVVCEQQ